MINALEFFDKHTDEDVFVDVALDNKPVYANACHTQVASLIAHVMEGAVLQWGKVVNLKFISLENTEQEFYEEVENIITLNQMLHDEGVTKGETCRYLDAWCEDHIAQSIWQALTDFEQAPN